MCTWRALAAPSGALSSQSASIRVSLETTWFALRSRMAKSARCFAPVTSIGPPSSLSSSRPRIPYRIRTVLSGDVTPSKLGHSDRPQYPELCGTEQRGAPGWNTLTDTLVPDPGTRTIPSAEGGGRTHTPFRTPDFESGASANSATSACEGLAPPPPSRPSPHTPPACRAARPRPTRRTPPPVPHPRPLPRADPPP